eukprot:CAMPEP_0176468878 /NCGR_PEP_ID=MMETSP0127-20121128/39407_1 /TAXON_ID=938130 /ORGANISM="Platyophrya macrostoma, Strain WH" /LENGTH=114 /DNA_ID=CAMNT_0017862635 /DNA_START=256 /DNA_END=600 /DNA_ORIENTATION=-
MAFEPKWERYCPELLPATQDEDKFSDSDSDDETSIRMDVPEIDDFLSTLESDDVKIKDLRKRDQTGIFDEKEHTVQYMNMSLENEKNQWIAVLPSKMNTYNKQVNNKGNTIIIQ